MERQSYRTHTGASSPAFDGGDVIAVSLMDCASQQMFGETTMIELDINNRVGSTLSSDKRPAILTVVPHRGNVAGINFHSAIVRAR